MNAATRRRRRSVQSDSPATVFSFAQDCRKDTIKRGEADSSAVGRPGEHTNLTRNTCEFPRAADSREATSASPPGTSFARPKSRTFASPRVVTKTGRLQDSGPSFPSELQLQPSLTMRGVSIWTGKPCAMPFRAEEVPLLRRERSPRKDRLCNGTFSPTDAITSRRRYCPNLSVTPPSWRLLCRLEAGATAQIRTAPR